MIDAARPLSREWRPPHAYQPGRTARHPEDLFDAIKADTSGPAEATEAWTFGLLFLRDGYFWEAHEVLEPLWLAAAPNSAEREFLRGVIQLANAGLKRRMGREGAATRLLDEANRLFAEAFGRSDGPLLGLSQEDVDAMQAGLP